MVTNLEAKIAYLNAVTAVHRKAYKKWAKASEAEVAARQDMDDARRAIEKATAALSDGDGDA